MTGRRQLLRLVGENEGRDARSVIRMAGSGSESHIGPLLALSLLCLRFVGCESMAPLAVLMKAVLSAECRSWLLFVWKNVVTVSAEALLDEA